MGPKTSRLKRANNIGYVRRRSQYISISKQPNSSLTSETTITKQNSVTKPPNGLNKATLVNTGGSIDGFISTSAGRAKKILDQSKNQHSATQTHVSSPPLNPKVNPSHTGHYSQEALIDNTSWLKNFFSRQRLVTAMAVVLFMTGSLVSWQSFVANREIQGQAKTLARQSTENDESGNAAGGADIPDEDSPPPSIAGYRTSPLLPRVITIPSIGTAGRVLPLGVKENGQLKAPVNIYDTGWYEDSSKPGEHGAMLIDGHVSGPTKPAVFKNLDKLVPGHKIEVERGDGRKFSYTVKKVETIPVSQVNMANLLVPVEAGRKGLNLITCGGEFDKSSNKYLQRTIVYAVQD